jgi:hypothetical protein
VVITRHLIGASVRRFTKCLLKHGLAELGPFGAGNVGAQHQVDNQRSESLVGVVVNRSEITSSMITRLATHGREHACTQQRVFVLQKRLEGQGQAVVLLDAGVVVLERKRIRLPDQLLVGHPAMVDVVHERGKQERQLKIRVPSQPEQGRQRRVRCVRMRLIAVLPKHEIEELVHRQDHVVSVLIIVVRQVWIVPAENGGDVLPDQPLQLRKMWHPVAIAAASFPKE